MRRFLIGFLIALLSTLLCLAATCNGSGGGPTTIPKGYPDIGTQRPPSTDTGRVNIPEPASQPAPEPQPEPTPATAPQPAPEPAHQTESITVVAPAPITAKTTAPPFTPVRVFYGTDRLRRHDFPRVQYGNGRSTELAVGWAMVNIPGDYVIGHPNLPSKWSREDIDPSKYVFVNNTEQHVEAEFVQELQREVQRSASKEAFVFVHGYEDTFEDAILHTALLAADLKFDGAPIVFTWPGDRFNYFSDEESLDFAIPDLEKFLVLVAKRSGAKKIHLIAHSMGNRALLHAVDNLHSKGWAPNNIAQAILAAPDVDTDVFTRFITALISIAHHTTLYASSSDAALQLSHGLHNNVRAGEGGNTILLVNGIDSVDVSAVDIGLSGHSYHVDNVFVADDLARLINDANPDVRTCLIPRARENHKYWVFKRCAQRWRLLAFLH